MPLNRITWHIRLLVDRINVLAVHIKTYRHKQVKYNLYMEVHFHGGVVRSCITDQDGRNPMSLRSLRKPPTEWIVANRLFFLREMISQASDQWKPALEAWLAQQ